MHELFKNVLSKRDLSRAGDLFSVSDAEIVSDLNEVLANINIIISNPDYIQNRNDQSVVEICITRITSCIRETRTAERHCIGLVALLETCLKYNLHPKGRNEDPPHAKICGDIISSIFLNYKEKTVMEIVLPVAVKFLQKENKELIRNLASYLSLAANDYACYLSPHVQLILDSIISGNYALCRALPEIYKVSPEPLILNAPLLVALLPQCDIQEKEALLHLFELIAETTPAILENSTSRLCDCLVDSSTASTTMMVLLKITEHRPGAIYEHFDIIKASAKIFPSTVSLAAKILSAAGKNDKARAQNAFDFILEQLPHTTDRTSQKILRGEAINLCRNFPVLFSDKYLAIMKRNTQLQQSQATSAKQQSVNQTSGGVTIVKLNSTDAQQNSIENHVTATVLNNNHAAGTASTTSNGNFNPALSSSSQIFNHNTPMSLPTGQILSPVSNHNVVTIPGLSAETKSYQVNSNAGMVSSIHAVPPTPPYTGYTRRAKLGDSRSTGRLHPGSNTQRSMTRLNNAGGSVGGLHKSMTKLSSSQQINQNCNGAGGGGGAVYGAGGGGGGGIHNGSNSQNFNCNSSGSVSQAAQGHLTSQNYASPHITHIPSNVFVTGHNKYVIPPTKIKSGGVTVTTSPPRVRPHSQGPSTLLGSSGALGRGSSNGLSIFNQSTGSIGHQYNSVSVHHASPASPTFSGQQSVMTLPVNSIFSSNNNQVSVSGPATTQEVPRRNDNTSVTIISNTNTQRMSVFEPYPMRDTIQHFCEKHLDKIKSYMKEVSRRLPPSAKCIIEERRSKKLVKLYFACQARGPHCLYSKTFFTVRTRNPKTWIHLMFLDLQAREPNALSSRDAGVSSLRHCWDTLKCENKTFMTLVTSAFPLPKDKEILENELRHSGFFDVFELGSVNCSNDTLTSDTQLQWACFMCNHPDKAVGFLHDNTQPVIEGQLKEKKGKWRLFRRWRTRYFTLSGAHLSCKSSGGESIDINQIRSVKVSRGARNIPKAFEIFTGDQTLILKPKDGKNVEEWVQYLSIFVAHSQARVTPAAKTNSLPARKLGNSRNAF